MKNTNSFFRSRKMAVAIGFVLLCFNVRTASSKSSRKESYANRTIVKNLMIVGSLALRLKFALETSSLNRGANTRGPQCDQTTVLACL